MSENATSRNAEEPPLLVSVRVGDAVDDEVLPVDNDSVTRQPIGHG